jgi:hypothetical protein
MPQGLAKRGGDGGLWAPFWTLLRDAMRGIAPQDEGFGGASAAFPSASYGQAFQAAARRLRAKSLGVLLKAAKVARKRS